MNKLLIRQRFLNVQSMYREYVQLKALVEATEDFHKREKERGESISDNEMIDRMKHQILRLETKLDKLLN